MSWWNSSWSYRKKLTFDNSGQSENLVNFPVLVALTDANFNFAKAKDNGEDIRFVDGDDSTELKYEIEKWDKAGEKAYIWVKVPQIDSESSTDYIYMYYGNSGASDNQDADNTWEAHYGAVWHLKEASGTTPDSSGNSNTGTVSGVTQGQTGQIHLAHSYDGVDDITTVQEDPSIDITGNTYLTGEAWIKPASDGEGDLARILDKAGAYLGYFLLVREEDVGGVKLRAQIRFITDTANYASATTSTRMTLNAWHYVAFVFNENSDNKIQLYIDGDLQNLEIDTAGTGTLGDDSGQDLIIGNNADQTRTFDGLIDEIRISDNARSNKWIKAQYLSMTGAFITFGGEDGQFISSDLGLGGEVAPTLLAASLVSDTGSGLDIGGLWFGVSDLGSGLDTAGLWLEAGDLGSGVEALIARLLAVGDAGSAVEASLFPEALATVDSGLGADVLVSLLVAITGGEEGSGSDRLRVKIESAAKGGGMRLTPGTGATSIPSREVHL